MYITIDRQPYISVNDNVRVGGSVVKDMHLPQSCLEIVNEVDYKYLSCLRRNASHYVCQYGISGLLSAQNLSVTVIYDFALAIHSLFTVRNIIRNSDISEYTSSGCVSPCI